MNEIHKRCVGVYNESGHAAKYFVLKADGRYALSAKGLSVDLPRRAKG